MNYCVDCKYFVDNRPKSFLDSFFSPPRQFNPDMCSNPNCQDYVYGTNIEARICRLGKCGIEGKFFEAK